MGAPLNIVHRDVSPQNVMVATDGSARLLDFGVAKATMAAHVTRDGTFKGKLAYSAPEQLEGKATPQSDVYALSVVLWELVVGHRLHGSAQGEAELVANVMSGKLPSICEALGGEAEWGALDDAEWTLIEKLDPIVSKGFAVDLAKRWSTAAEMERALLDAVSPAPPSEVAAWVKSLGKEFLDGRDKVIAAEEQSWRRAHGSTPGPVPLRLATVPGTVRTGTKHPAAPGAKKNTIIVVLGALIVVLGIGLVFAMSSGSPKVRTPAPPPTAPAVAAPVARPQPERAAQPEAVAQPEPPPEPAAKPVEPATKTAAAALGTALAAPPVRTATVRRHAPVRAAVKPPEPVAPAVAPPPAPEPAKDDCNPPYYFEGEKKIFKPACI
jgi:serine/threonine-protein kinase